MRRDIQKQQWTGRRKRVKWTAYLIPVALCLVFLIGVSLVLSNKSDDIRVTQAVEELDHLQFPAATATMTTLPERDQGEAADTTETSKPSVTMTNAPMTLPRHDFASLKEKNEDITAWITIPGLISEPVVQRDNVFYMTHDVMGRVNGNGAIFMDAWEGFQEDRQTLILYGHNMRSGQMFGKLWQYENETFRKKHPVIYLDSASDMEEYRVFAAGIFGIEENMPNYLNILNLYSKNTFVRLEAIRVLLDNSEIEGGTVREDEQMLLLITCVDEENERRYVAAKRIVSPEI